MRPVAASRQGTAPMPEIDYRIATPAIREARLAVAETGVWIAAARRPRRCSCRGRTHCPGARASRPHAAGPHRAPPRSTRAPASAILPRTPPSPDAGGPAP